MESTLSLESLSLSSLSEQIATLKEQAMEVLLRTGTSMFVPSLTGNYSDNAGTIAANVGGTVGYVSNLNPQIDVQLKQSTEIQKPTLQLDGTNPAWKFVGAGNNLVATTNTDSTGNQTVGVCIKTDNITAWMAMYGDNASGTNGSRIGMHNTSGKPRVIFRQSNGVGPTIEGTTSVKGRVCVITEQYTKSTGFGELFDNSVSVATNTTVLTSNPSTAYYFGSLPALGDPYSGLMYGCYYSPTTLSSSDRLILDSYIGSLGGLNL